VNEIHHKNYPIAKESKVAIKKKPPAAAPWTLPDMLDFDSFFWLVRQYL